MRRIRGWYRGQPRWVRRINILALIILAVSLATALAKSAPELRAIAWHYRHGNYITVNGVRFSIYYWYTPHGYEGGDQFWVRDFPGPLRPGDDFFTAFEIRGWRNQQDGGTRRDLVQKEVAGYEKAGHRGVQIFEVKISGPILECWVGQDFSGSFSCYGDGPIYHVSFTGHDASAERFRRMLADAQ